MNRARATPWIALVILIIPLAGCLEPGSPGGGPAPLGEGTPPDESDGSRRYGNWTVRVDAARDHAAPGETIPITITVQPARDVVPPESRIRFRHWTTTDETDDDGFVAIPPAGRTIQATTLVGFADDVRLMLIEGAEDVHEIKANVITRTTGGTVSELVTAPIANDSAAPLGLSVNDGSASAPRTITYRLDEPGATCSLVENPRGRAFGVNGTVVILIEWSMTDVCYPDAPARGIVVEVPEDFPESFRVQAANAANVCFCPRTHQPTGWTAEERTFNAGA